MKRHGSMNHIFRLVWSHVLNGWVAVAEKTRGRGKSASRKLAAALTSAAALVAGSTYAAPIGGQVVVGSASIAQTAATTNIRQTSATLAVNWKSFNIGQQETVNFQQPSVAAIAVNRIFDTNGTQILGHLNANGQVYLINPNGILFGKGAEVNVGGLVAATLALDGATLDGNTKSFSGAGAGSVVNQGVIKGDYVALLGQQVRNQGVISAQMGSVALGAGSAITLEFNGNKLLNMQIDQSVLNNLAENGGLITVDGGRVLMSAGAKNSLLASVVNNTGVIEARTLEQHEGTITLLGGMAAGSVHVGGTLDASAPTVGNGGFIETSAARVIVASDAKITTAGAQGGKLGQAGTWLIDPVDFTIAATGGDMSGAYLSNELLSNNITIASSNGTTGGTLGNVNVNDAVSWSANKLTLNALNNIYINAPMNGGANGSSATLTLAYGQNAVFAGNASNYFVSAPISLPAGSSFTTVLGSNGTPKIYTVINSLGSASDATAVAPPSTLQGMAATSNLSGNFALGSNIDATATAGENLSFTSTFTPIGNGGSPFMGSFDGLGHTISNLTVNLPSTDHVGLFGSISGSAVVQNIGLINPAVSGMNYVGALAGYNLGTVLNSYASMGSVMASNLGNSVGGLVGYNGGKVGDSYATVAVTGAASGNSDGGLVGANYNGTINNSYATGNVSGGSGSNAVGGLVGDNSNGTINTSYAAGTVSGAATTGGLIGSGVNNNKVFGSFWDIATSGQSTSAGGTGLSDAAMMTRSSFTTATPAWDFANIWVNYDTHTYPLLRYFMTPLTVTASSASKVYNGNVYSGGTTASYTTNFSSASSTTTPSNVFGSLSYSYSNNGITNSGINVGAYVVTPAGLYSNQQAYIINYSTAGTLNVTPATLTFNANQATRLYGAINPALTGGAVTGFVGSDNVNNATTGTASYSSTAGTTSNVGNYLVSGMGLTANNGNYVFAQAAANNTALSVTPVTLTVTANAASRLYGAANPALDGTVSGFVAGDTQASATTGTETYVGSATAMSSVGNYGISGSGLVANNGNYVFAQSGVNTTALSVTPATLTVTATPVSRLYGSVNPALTGTVSGFMGTDNQTNATSGTESYVSGASTTSNVGNYGITASGLSASNYIFVAAAANTSALNVTPATLTVTATPVSRMYGSVNPALSGTITGFVGMDTQTNATTGVETYASGATTMSNVGSYGITASGLSASNYIFMLAAANISALSVTPAPLTVTANSISRLYGDANPVLSSTISGYVNGETASTAGVQGAATLSTPANATSNVGSAVIQVGNGSLTAMNYSFSNLANGILSITPRPVNLIGSRVYDGSTNAASEIFTMSNLANEDTLTLSGLGSVASKNVLAGSQSLALGSLALQNGSGLASNYTFSGGTQTASFIAKPLTVSATGSSKTYDGTTTANVMFDDNRVGADVLTLSYLAANFADKNAGIGKAIAVSGINGSGADFANYSLSNSTASSTANITQAALLLSALPLRINLGQAPENLSGSVTGLVAGDTLAGATSGTLSWITPATATSAANYYPINGVGLSSQNYSFAQAPGNTIALTVSPAAILDVHDVFPVVNEHSRLPTITEKQFTIGDASGDAATAAASSAAAAAAGDVSLIGTDIVSTTMENTRMSLVKVGSMLQIVYGGIKLPDSVFSQRNLIQAKQ